MQKLGQHFLINKSAVKKIIAALDLRLNDTIIEIGSGEGALTFPLAEACQNLNCKIIAIEKDKKMAEELRRKAEELKFNNLEILEGDALKILYSSVLRLKANKIVGNIPYYITGKLLRLLGELITDYPMPTGRQELPIANIVLMIQKEVAERICAKPPEMNLLAAAVQFWAEPKILFALKPGDFNPPPKVNSAVIILKTLNIKHKTKETENYYRLLHILFKQPRKTIINNLKSGLNLPKNEIESALKSLKINPDSRPQNLSLQQINSLLTILK